MSIKTSDQDRIPLSKGWVLVTGAALGSLTLLLLMGLVLLGISGREVPCNSIFLVNAVLSFGAALSAAFIGGNAAARGSIPLRFLNDNPIAISVSGGIAVLIIMLVLTSQLFGQRDCDEAFSVSCPVGLQSYAISTLRFGFCYPREGWELDAGAIDARAADIYIRRSDNRDVGVHFHVSLIPAGWAGKPQSYTQEVLNTWRQLDERITLKSDFIGGRDAFLFELNVRDRNGISRPTQVTHIYLDPERLLEVIITWFQDTPRSWQSDLKRIRSSLQFPRI